MNKRLYIIAGCNGAGKTTASFTILPEILDCKEFINADEIARGLSPFRPENVAIEAGRLMLKRFDDLLREGISFAFETTLSTKSYRQKILSAKHTGYKITLVFFWLRSVELAKNRVRTRVNAGGHNIEDNVIERRYMNGIRNLFDIYIPIADEIFIFDNSDNAQEIIAKKEIDEGLTIIDTYKYNKIKKYYGSNER
jgi:predicted ABC-type ATPase